MADVHPLLYPLFCKGALTLFGLSPVQSPEASILFLRLFSTLPTFLLSLLGFTHVRKRFGETSGLLFSLFAGFSPSSVFYALQIRMYSWAALFVFCALLCALSLLEAGSGRKNWFFLCFFSLLGGYTHYYALGALVFLQIILLFLLWKKYPGQRKIWFLCIFFQIFCYLPGLLLFFQQAISVTGGYWITITYPNILGELIGFFFQGCLPLLPALLMGLLTLLLLPFGLSRLEKREKSAVLLCLLPMTALWAFGLLISLWKPLFIARYSFVLSGLYWLMTALLLEAVKKKELTFSFLALFCTLSLWNSSRQLSILSQPENESWKKELSSELEKEDVFFCSDPFAGCQGAAFFPGIPLYFYNQFSWTNKNGLAGFEALQSIESPFTLADCLSSGQRVWVFDSNKTHLGSFLESNFTCILPETAFFHPYSNTWLRISLWQKP